jgi:Arc/MetJ-type ribon-helix-helix transcriptional regulator
MSLVLDPATEQRIQRELARGVYSEPTEVIAHALDLLEAERKDLATRRAEIIAELENSIAQADRGEGYDEAQLRVRMAARRAARQQTTAA